MDVNIALRTFVRTVETGSLTAAARDLSITQPAVTKHLRNLEHHVQARLLERTSRSLRLTAHGAALYETSRNALADIDAAIEGVRRQTGRIEGKLRIHVPSCLGTRYFHRFVMEFKQRHPTVSIDLILDHRQADLLLENFDLSVVYGKPTGQDQIARRIGFVRRIIVASPDFLHRTGKLNIKKLSEVDLVATTTILSPRGLLPLLHKGRSIAVPVRPALKTNNAEVLIASLKGGLGLGPVQQLLVSDALADGSLVHVLPDYEVKPTEAFLVYPTAKFLRPAVRSFVDYAMPKLRAIEGIDQRASA
ncbi:HTH-type transcriptional regulator DmlR [Variibacter gotjawalensis]|uniref:HTH-type transcriptional regulator DmlR n=1 Tax=Variibacter gotjawalensis TaxID=1333996 RepID=A0A0S3Q0I5_9BRAD|nr:LysR family transcriptional regulator [Variibacter gotjawalensis]NIK47531.1 DNA-binding transcriptional LysR family regulator [Variibacter gotjawalensis]RZS49428.1 LysR family transcriptional regulator [Variibacter gotjawalensis]BAT61691.1 HTH-type transcriptional regulator DmlR [Variibacter gotjawalensis]